MRNPAKRLQKHQAGIRCETVGAAAEHVAGELEEVGGGVEPTQTELEAILAGGCAVAGAGIATADVHGGDDFTAEADRLWLVEVLDGERDASRLAAGRNDQGAGTVLLGHQVAALIQRGDVAFDAQDGEGRDIANGAVSVLAADDDLLFRSRPG